MQHLADEGVGESEQHSNTNTDQEGCVDQTGQQEHFGLQSIHQLGLASGGFEVFAAHDSDTDTCTDSTQTNNKTASESNESNVGHDNSLVKNRVIKKSKKLLCKKTLRPNQADLPDPNSVNGLREPDQRRRESAS